MAATLTPICACTRSFQEQGDAIKVLPIVEVERIPERTFDRNLRSNARNAVSDERHGNDGGISLPKAAYP
jgi:hypothetical protein